MIAISIHSTLPEISPTIEIRLASVMTHAVTHTQTLASIEATTDQSNTATSPVSSRVRKQARVKKSIPQKKASEMLAYFCGTAGRNRTGTPVRAQNFESCVSTNSTTAAYVGVLPEIIAHLGS